MLMRLVANGIYMLLSGFKDGKMIDLNGVVIHRRGRCSGRMVLGIDCNGEGVSGVWCSISVGEGFLRVVVESGLYVLGDKGEFYMGVGVLDIRSVITTLQQLVSLFL